MAPNTAILVEQSTENDEASSDTVAINEGAPSNTTNQDDGNNDIQVSFSHVHIHVDHVQDLKVYKQLEHDLNCGNRITDVETEFCPQNRDLVQQLLCGFGFRVTGVRRNTTTTSETNTYSVLVTSKDPQGVQFVITSIDSESQSHKMMCVILMPVSDTCVLSLFDSWRNA